MSLVDVKQLIQAFSNTLAASKECRDAGEEYLNCAKRQNGFLVTLCHIAASGRQQGYDEGIIVAVLIYLKNQINRHWRTESEEKDSTDPIYTEDERTETKKLLLQLSASTPPALASERRVIDEIIYLVLLSDFPDQWPELSGTVIHLCQERSQITQLIAGVNILVKLGRKYDLSRAEVAINAIGSLLEVCCEHLFDLMNYLVQQSQLFSSNESSYLVKQFCKLYFITAHSMRKTAYYQRSHDKWMNFLAVVLQTPIAPEMLSSTAIIDSNFAVKAKKWALYSVRTSIIRFCTPRHTQQADETSLPQAASFREKHALNFIRILSQLLMDGINAQKQGSSPGLSSSVGLRVGSVRADGVVVPFIYNDKQLSVILDTLSQTLEFTAGYKLLKPLIEGIIVSICHPLMSYSDKDIEDRDLDPAEFARSNSSASLLGSLDSSNPAHSAGSFLAAVMRLRSKDFLAFTSKFIQSELEAYAKCDNSLKGAESEASRRKYGALRMLAEVAPRLTCKKRNLNVVIEDLLYMHVTPELTSTDPWLRGCAAYVLGCMFQSWELQIVKPEVFVEFLIQILRNCRDDDCTVRVETLRALAVLVTLENDTVKSFISRHVEDVCALLVGMADNLDISESAVSALTELVESFPDEVLSVAPGMIQKLTATFLAMSSSMKNMMTNSTMSQNEGDQLEYTASSVSQTLLSVVLVLSRDKLCSQHMESIAHLVVPYLDYAISPEGEEYLEDALAILALITYDIPTIPPAYWKYFDALYQAVCGGSAPTPPTSIYPNGDWGVCELPGFVGTLDNYLMRGRDYFISQVSPLTNVAYKDEYLQMIKTGFSTSEANLDNPLASLIMIWLLVDAFGNSMSLELVDMSVQLIEWYLNVQKSQGNEISRLAQEQLVKIYASLIASSGLKQGAAKDICQQYDNTLCSQILERLNKAPTFNLQSWVKLAVTPKFSKQIETKKALLAAWAILIDRMCTGKEDQTVIQQSGEQILKSMAQQAVYIAKARDELQAMEDADDDSDWDENSEQELEENEDAAPSFVHPAILQKLQDRGLLDEDDEGEDDDYVDANLTDFGERRSPLDAICENVTVLKSIERHSNIYAKVIGHDDLNQLVQHLQVRIAAGAKQ